jgi:hypothetical protein
MRPCRFRDPPSKSMAANVSGDESVEKSNPNVRLVNASSWIREEVA